MDRNAVILAVTLSLFLLTDARLHPSAADVAVSVRDPRENATAAESSTVSVDLRPLRATSLPPTTTGGDRDISHQIAHSLRRPNLNRHASRPLRVPPVELPYGHDMIESSKFEEKEEGFKKKRRRTVKKEREDISDDEDEDEEEEKIKKKLRKTTKKKLKLEREIHNGGFFRKWISGFLN